MPKRHHNATISRWGSGWDFHPLAGLIMAGGWGTLEGHTGWQWLDKVERSVDYGVSFQELAPIPPYTQPRHLPFELRTYHGRAEFCLTIVDESTVFALGGRFGPDWNLINDELLKLDLETNEWTTLGRLNRGNRHGRGFVSGITGHSCFNREGEIFVVGGTFQDNIFYNDVDIYNIATGVWRKSEFFQVHHHLLHGGAGGCGLRLG